MQKPDDPLPRSLVQGAQAAMGQASHSIHHLAQQHQQRL